jgi:cell wall assembly regulator SMI1
MPQLPTDITYRTQKSFGTNSVDDAWDRIEYWLAEHLPETRKALNPPAKAREIEALERAIGNKLPESVKNSYRRHNGHKDVSAGMFFGLPLLPLDGIYTQWNSWSGYDDSKETKYNFDDGVSCFPLDYVQPVYFSRNWIPFSDDAGGNHLAIDLWPGEKGTIGQIIVCGRDDTFHPVLALDFAQFLADVAEEMELGNAKIEPHDPEDGPEFNIAAPATHHFNSVGANWSRCKLGLRTLSEKDEELWNRNRRK